jgi:hypothetical protein
MEAGWFGPMAKAATVGTFEGSLLANRAQRRALVQEASRAGAAEVLSDEQLRSMVPIAAVVFPSAVNRSWRTEGKNGGELPPMIVVRSAIKNELAL